MKWLSSVMCIIVLLTTVGWGQQETPARMWVLVPENHLTYDGVMGGTPGGYCYHESSGRFYTSTYGANLGIRAYISPDQEIPLWAELPLDRANGKSWLCATESDLLRVANSVDIPGGLTDPDLGISCAPSGMIINPAPVTVNGITYEAGELVILSNNSSTKNPSVGADQVKRMFTWDFREIWTPTDQAPDYDNAEWMPGLLITDIFGPDYGLGWTNWNDAFNSVMSIQDITDAIVDDLAHPVDPDKVFKPIGTKATDNIGGRQYAFSSDASKVYFVSMNSASYGYGGVYSLDLETQKVKRLVNNAEPEYIKVKSEPAVLSIGTRNLTGVDYDPSYDQVLFTSTDLTGNEGGLSCVVDDGSDNPPVHVALDRDRLLDFFEFADPDLESFKNIPEAWSIATDEEGVVYFYTKYKPASTTRYALVKYDLQGRLAVVAHGAMQQMFNRSLGKTSTSGMFLRLQTRMINVPLNADDPNDPGLDIPQAMFMSVGGKCIAGVDIFPTGDFDRDGQITVADMNFFKAQIQLSRADNVPLLTDGQAYLHYLECDLNGSSEIYKDPETKQYVGLGAPSVTDKDIEVLYQFVTPGDANLDGVVDAADQAVVEANMGTATGMDWSMGDFDFDDDVDADDQALLTASMG